jgi:hypothetical protein
MTQEALKLALEALVAVHIEGDVECVVTPNGTIYLRPAITAIKEALAQPEDRPWVDLTDTQIENIYNEVVKIHRGVPTPHGQVVFGRAVQAKLRELNAPQIDPNQWAFDNELEST